MTKYEKMLCDFIVMYGNDNSANRGFHDTYDNVMKEYNSIKLDSNITWKQVIWEPLKKPDVQKVIKQDSVKVIEILGAKMVVYT